MSLFLSVVIPTYNRLESLKLLVARIKAQSLAEKNSEVIIVNDGSTDGTEAFLNSLRDPWIRVLHQTNQGQAKARSLGVEASIGDILLFLDDDMEPASRTFLDAHLSFHHMTNLPTVAIGPILAPSKSEARPAFEYFYERSIHELYESFRRGTVKPSGSHFFSANVSLPKKLYLRSGGFSPHYRQAEDRELGLRLEYEYEGQFAFVEAAGAIHHSGTRRFKGFLSRAYAYGRYDLKIAKSFPEHDELSPYQIFAKPPFLKMFVSKCAWRMPGLMVLWNTPLTLMAKLLKALGLTSAAIKMCSLLYCINYVVGLKDEHVYES